MVTELLSARAPRPLPVADASGMVQLWLHNGFPQKYIVTIVGVVSLPFGRKVIKKDSTVTIMEIGSTKLEVPPHATIKLGYAQ